MKSKILSKLLFLEIPKFWLIRLIGEITYWSRTWSVGEIGSAITGTAWLVVLLSTSAGSKILQLILFLNWAFYPLLVYGFWRFSLRELHTRSMNFHYLTFSLRFLIVLSHLHMLFYFSYIMPLYIMCYCTDYRT